MKKKQKCAKNKKMPGLPSTYFFLHKKFHDLYDFSHSVYSWDTDFRQLDSGSFKADLLQVDLGNFQFSHAHFNRHLIQRGCSPPNLYTFAIPANSSQRIIWRGKELPENGIMVYSPGMEIDGTTWPGFNIYTFSLPPEMLENHSRMFDCSEILDLVCDRDVLICNSSMLKEFRQWVRFFYPKIENGQTGVAEHNLPSEFNFRNLEQLLTTVASSRSVKHYTSSRSRNQALKKAMTYISEYSQECPTVQMICQAAGVSKRTLEYAFLERFGVSPKAFLQAFRLNGVYRELRRRDPSSTSIVDVANHWGFWHMGQFAADYRKLFGELPSETLRKL